MVGLTEPQAREKGQKEGFDVSVAKTTFKANTKATNVERKKKLEEVMMNIEKATNEVNNLRGASILFQSELKEEKLILNNLKENIWHVTTFLQYNLKGNCYIF